MGDSLPSLPYPGIAAACFYIALDNGGINRNRSEKKWQSDYKRWIAKQDGPLPEIDGWLSALPKERLELVASGGEVDPETIAAREGMPAFTDDLLNAYFDEVC